MTAFWSVTQEALKDLRDQRLKPLQVLLSGGTQSLMLAQLLLTAKVDFQAHIFSFASRNSYDIEGAIRFCGSRGISYQVHDFDFPQFVRTRYLRRLEKYPWANMLMLLLMDFQEALSMEVISAAFLPEVSIRPSGIFQALSVKKEFIPQCYRGLLFFQMYEEVREAWLQHPRMSTWKELQSLVGFEDTRDWRETLIRADWKEFKSPIPWLGYEAFRSDIEAIAEAQRFQGSHDSFLIQEIV